MNSETVIPPVLVLRDGLVGLPDVQHLDAVPIAGGAFVELLSRDIPGLGWLVTSAEDVRGGMTAALRATGRIEPDEVLLVILASHGDPAIVTANLAGPLAVTPDGFARQLVIEDPSYPVRSPMSRLAPQPLEVE
jgi:hypothetical protein